MHVTTIKPKNSTEISSPKLNLYSKKIGNKSSIRHNLANKQNKSKNYINIHLREENINCL